MTYPSQEYKEIEQVRAYDVQSLVGNVGGYIGLFLGYALRELPTFLLLGYNAICYSFELIIRGRVPYIN